MVKYKEVYINFFDYCISEYIPCEYCSSPAIDIHHLIFKSQGGKDVIENLIALCRDCHNKAHNEPGFNNYLKEIHANNIKRFAEN
jgi:5-methylcytosine-specific restriction endonuclease McrA